MIRDLGKPQKFSMTRKLKVHKICGTQDPRRRGDVVFVHGLNGDARTTWQPEGKPDGFWPEWLCEDVSGVGVWSLDYPASSSKWKGSTMPLKDRALTALDELVTSEIGMDRPVVFIAHSFGGLLVKEMLRKAADGSFPQANELTHHTRGVVFIATPHSGSNWANFASCFGLSQLLRTNENVKELRLNELSLEELKAWYSNNAGPRGIATMSYRETEPTKAGRGHFLGLFKSVVVDAASSDPGIARVSVVPVEEDHIAISRPQRTDTHYRSIRRFVDLLLKEVELNSTIVKTEDLFPGAVSFKLVIERLNPVIQPGRRAQYRLLLSANFNTERKCVEERDVVFGFKGGELKLQLDGCKMPYERRNVAFDICELGGATVELGGPEHSPKWGFRASGPNGSDRALVGLLNDLELGVLIKRQEAETIKIKAAFEVFATDIHFESRDTLPSNNADTLWCRGVVECIAEQFPTLASYVETKYEG